MVRSCVLEMIFVFLFVHRACCSDEMEDFPLDAEDSKNNESADLLDEAASVDALSNTDKFDLGKVASPSGEITLFNKIMLAAMKRPGAKQRIAQVLPIIRAMSPGQRLTLATLVLNQLAAKTTQHNFDPLVQFDNTTAELMIPVSADIASIFQGLEKDAGSGRSNGFGTYFYNPLSAGYRVGGPQSQRPPLYNVRRFQFLNGRRKDDVPPEMMPPPYTSSSNFSYANFNKPSETSGHELAENEDEVVHDGSDENNDKDGGDNTTFKMNECVPFINNLCLDVSAYPNKNIMNSIKNLEQKHVFRALLEDAISNVTAENPEIERRYGSEDINNYLQICDSKVKYARPKKAKSLKGYWKFVVNTEQYTQTVRIETCSNIDKSCSYLSENIKSRCTQIYNYHRLLTWDENAGLSLDLFKIPTCCSCQIQHASSFIHSKKYPQKPDIGIQENVIMDEPTVFHPSISKPNKPKMKPNALFNAKREQISRPRRPPILPLHHELNNFHQPIRYAPNDNVNRRASIKNNSFKSAYTPANGTPVESAFTESTSQSHRVNYNYHPIIDFFKSTPAAPIDKADIIDDWQPMTEGPRTI